MNYYKDFEYIKYILNLDFDSGFNLYISCLQEINNNYEKEYENKLYKLWLVNIQQGLKEDFSSFYKKAKIKAKQTSLSDDVKQSEEDRIISEIENKQIERVI